MNPDIDGLRTLAVVPVVLFHAYPELFPGGFIGVDIFFVISGYLISGILLKEHAADQFSYYNFYSRRIRRIFPILLVVLSTTLWMGCLYFLASKLKALAATMLAGSLFCANLQVLSLEKGYFDDDIKTNPLLHLWSLGVEEQFYIIWPFFVSLVARLTSIRRAVVYQVVFMGLSFVMNVAMLGFHGTNKFSFYFPLCRFWQMSIGGLVAFLHSHDALKQLGTSKLMSISGLICIVIGFILIDELRAFPGYWALFPTCGAALLIAAGPEAPFNYNILSSQVMVYVGKISYALYLWHWPLLVFAKARFPNDAFRPFYMQPYVMILVAVALSINFSGFENRVRRIKSKWVVVILLVIMAGVSVLSLAVYKFPKSFSLTELSFQDVVPPTDIELEVVPEVSEVATNASNKLPKSFLMTELSAQDVAPPKDFETQIMHALVALVQSALNASATMNSDNISSVVKVTSRISTSQTVQVSQDGGTLAQPNPSRERFVKQVTFRQAVAAWKDMDDAWFVNLIALDEKSVYGYHKHAQILNPDHEATDGLVVVLGDSHADMLKPRFVKLYRKAQKGNASFPTMVFKTDYGPPTLSCRTDTQKDFDMVLRTTNEKNTLGFSIQSRQQLVTRTPH
ncbi:hypothetical protein AC1031_006049 [Aphanomyces cochlioides]|nr:hypothetical protein AC1031_006049 [Aphanomyces cochlioides]